MSELSPEKIALLKAAVDIQEQMLAGCVVIFEGLRLSSDPEVAPYCDEAIQAIRINRLTLEALIDRTTATIH